MRPAARARDVVARHYAVIAAVGVRQQNLLVLFQKLLRPVAAAVQGEVEHVVGMFGVTHVHPHARRLGLAHAQHGQHGVVGGHHVRGPHPFGHALVQRFHQIGHRPAPHRLRGPRNLESLAGENLFQPVKRQVVGKLAGHDVRQEARPRQAALEGRLRPRRHRDLRLFSGRFARPAGILLAHVLDALEVPGQVLDLPALLRADLLPLPSAARAGPLFPAQLVDLRGHRKILEVRQRPPSPAPLYPPLLARGLSSLGNILRVDRLLLQLLAEVQERLRQLAA